jgi:ATPase subunit of ABC transporter with duplicated ATPase domains
MNRIALIGPTGVGKTTVAKLLSAQMGLLHVSLDTLRHDILKQIADYDPDHAAKLRKDNFEALIAYREQFNPTVVKRVIANHERGIFDFGAIHSTHDVLNGLNTYSLVLTRWSCYSPAPTSAKALMS